MTHLMVPMFSNGRLRIQVSQIRWTVRFYQWHTDSNYFTVFPYREQSLAANVSSQWLKTRHKSSRSYTQHCTHSHSVVISNSTVHTQGKQMSFPDSPELAAPDNIHSGMPYKRVAHVKGRHIKHQEYSFFFFEKYKDTLYGLGRILFSHQYLHSVLTLIKIYLH